MISVCSFFLTRLPKYFALEKKIVKTGKKWRGGIFILLLHKIVLKCVDLDGQGKKKREEEMGTRGKKRKRR